MTSQVHGDKNAEGLVRPGSTEFFISWHLLKRAALGLFDALICGHEEKALDCAREITQTDRPRDSGELKKLVKIWTATNQEIPADVELYEILTGGKNSLETLFDELRAPIRDALKTRIKEEPECVWRNISDVPEAQRKDPSARSHWPWATSRISDNVIADVVRVVNAKAVEKGDFRLKLTCNAFQNSLRQLTTAEASLPHAMTMDDMKASAEYVQCTQWTDAQIYLVSGEANPDSYSQVKFNSAQLKAWTSLDKIAHSFFGLCQQTAMSISPHQDGGYRALDEGIHATRFEQLDRMVAALDEDDPARTFYQESLDVWGSFLGSLEPRPGGKNKKSTGIAAAHNAVSENGVLPQADMFDAETNPNTHCDKRTALIALTQKMDTHQNSFCWGKELYHYLALAIKDSSEIPDHEWRAQNYLPFDLSRAEHQLCQSREEI